jgi:hypothetical protein
MHTAAAPSGFRPRFASWVMAAVEMANSYWLCLGQLEDDKNVLDKFVGEFVGNFPNLGLSKEEILKEEFTKGSPKSKKALRKNVRLRN